MGHQPSDRLFPAPRVPDGVDEDEPEVRLTALICAIGDAGEVADVLGYQDTTLALGCREDVGVRESAELRRASPQSSLS